MPIRAKAEWISRLLALSLVLSSVWAGNPAWARPASQEVYPHPRAIALLENLTAEERVGQLFLVTFQGQNTGPESEIYDLIVNHHVGGVILLAANDNFTGPEGTPEAVRNLTNSLQELEWESSLERQVDPLTSDPLMPAYIPLLVGTIQEGNGFPHDQLLFGLSPLPSPMALGATWQPEKAAQIGRILGRELAALGLNLLLGPSLDVLEAPFPESPGDLGTRTFGGDPFWVGKMGQAFISGVHEGSLNRVAVVGKHFPGHGGSDRLPEEEVATVRKQLEQLKQIELAPFFAVTGDAPTPQATVDALLTSHIRYQGLQGNIRATTNPISFDPQAFQLLMNLQPFVNWRGKGGLVISDDLGSRAVRGFYDPDGQTFNSRIVALNAFLAGNDMLYLGNIASANDPTNGLAIERTLEFFAQKYRDDPAFAQRVDESVLRILHMKFRLYDEFNLAAVMPRASDLAAVGQPQEISFEIARQAATLISPPSTELDNVLPDPPGIFDSIIFFTDTFPSRQCAECPELPVIAVDALQQAVVRLYGPDTGGQIQPYNLVSFSFEALNNTLDAPSGDSILERTLRSAEWVVFLTLNVDPNRPSSFALRRILAERPNLLRNKQVVVFAMDAPYFLDATEITKISAFYALYSKTAQFIEVAARLLFKEVRPNPGALPVSVPGIGYDLFVATSPDPSQTIPIFFNLPGISATQEAGTPPPNPEFKVGDLVPIRTGVILDHNGNPVPDNTEVRFFLTVAGQEMPPMVVVTTNGLAETSFILENTAIQSIQARSGDPAARSLPLPLNLPPEPGDAAPTDPIPSPTVSPTLEPTPTREAPAPTATPDSAAAGHLQTDVGDWFLAALVTGLVGWVAFRTGETSGQLRWGVRWMLCAVFGGLLVYAYLSLNFPGSAWLLGTGGRWAVLLLSLAGAGVGWSLGLLWRNMGDRLPV